MKKQDKHEGYIPPFTVSAEAITLIAEISAQIERYAIRLEQEDALRLRRANRIKTIHSSLAIEGNTLSEDEVRDIIGTMMPSRPAQSLGSRGRSSTLCWKRFTRH